MDFQDFQASLTSLQIELDQDSTTRQSLRDILRPLDRQVRSTQAILLNIHVVGIRGKDSIIRDVEKSLENVCKGFEGLKKLIKEDEFWKWHDMWKNVLQSASFCVLLLQWLRDETCATKTSISDTLHLTTPNFFLPTEDYLHSILTLVSELSRLSINSIPLQDYVTPLKISKFTKEISKGFGLLDLKNDNLRRHFDGLKYDNKKCEDVVYDLSVRGLIKSNPIDTQGEDV